MSEKDQEITEDKDMYPETEELKLRVRSDLYRAFRRCVWMTIYETGMTLDEVHNMFIEDLLKNKGC